MTLLLYGFVEGPFSGSGLGARPLRGVGLDPGPAAVVSDCAGPADPTADALWEYERAVEQLMDRGPVLPARFGTLVADEPTMLGILGERRAELIGALRRVRGAVELCVRAVSDEASVDSPRTGTEYMLGRLEQHRRARRLGQQIEPLGSLASASRVQLTPRLGTLVLASYLVGADRVGSFGELVRHIDAELDDAALICTGPWPPYSFADPSAA